MSSSPAATRLACTPCLRRAWLLAELTPALEMIARDRERLYGALALADGALIDSLGGRRREELRALHAGFGAGALPAAPSVAALCRHDERYPRALRGGCAPSMLHAEGGVERFGELAQGPVVALLGSRRPSDYGREMTMTLARGLAGSGVAIASVLCDGVGAAAQRGAQDGAIAVLGSGLPLSGRPRLRGLYERVARTGCAVSELPCQASGRRWGEPAAERTAALLAGVVIVIEARDAPRELAAARLARERGRPLAALPGRVTSALSAGPHALLLDGARAIRDAADVLELLYDGAARPPPSQTRASAGAPRERLPQRLRAILALVGAGADTPDRLLAAGAGSAGLLLALSELELDGHLARGENGRYVPRHPCSHSRI